MRNDLAILLALVCIGVATLVFPACTNPNSEVSDAEASHTEAVTYATYTNERFNYRLEYPAHFVAEGEPTNNDGQVFSGENVELRVFGTHNVQDESLRTIARSYGGNPEAAEITQNVSDAVIVRAHGERAETVVKAIALGAEQVGVLVLSVQNDAVPDSVRAHIIDSFVASSEADPARADGFTRYTNDGLGFSLLRPADAEVSTPTNDHVTIKRIGPGSEAGTEITDGFLVTVARDPEAERFDALRTYAQAVVAQERNDVTEPLERRTIGQNEAYRYQAQTELGGSATHYLFFPADGVGFHVTVSFSDPDDRGYAGTLQTMLESLTFAARSGGGTEASEGDTQQVQIALLDYSANGGAANGEARGCDRVVMVTREIAETQAPLTAALEMLFALDDTDVEGWQNFIARTNNTLTFRRARVEEGTAHIYLEGELSGLGGVCDNPRAAIQIEETALQFDTVEEVQLYLNGEPTDLRPDMRGP